MHDLTIISEKLRGVLAELESVTDDIETIQMQADNVANDDFLTRANARPENDR